MRMTTADAARELGVSARQIRRHAARGRVTSIRYGTARTISTRQVNALARMTRRGRDWNETTRIAALDLLSDGKTDTLVGSQRSRLKKRLRSIELPALSGQILVGHASLRRAASESAKAKLTPRLLPELELSSAASGLGVLVAENAAQVARRAGFGLDDEGDVVVIEGTERHHEVLEALTLYAYGDTRESSAAADWVSTRQASL